MLSLPVRGMWVEICVVRRRGSKTGVWVEILANDSECLAEAIGDIANGENASVLLKEIRNILKRELG